MESLTRTCPVCGCSAKLTEMRAEEFDWKCTACSWSAHQPGSQPTCPECGSFVLVTQLTKSLYERECTVCLWRKLCYGLYTGDNDLTKDKTPTSE